MKVCIVSRGDLDLFPPTQGASVKLFYTLNTLSELGVNMYFVSAEDNFYYEAKKGKFTKKNYPLLIANSQINIFHKKIMSWLGLPNDIFVLYHPLANIGLWLKLFYVVLKEKIDLIQAEFTAFGIPAIFTKILTGRPVILVEHNVESFQLPKITSLSSKGKKIVKTIEKFVCKFSDGIIEMCKEEAKRLEKLGIKRDKIYIIPHGVNLKLYKNIKSEKIRKRYGLKFPTLVFHGVYSYKPNYDAIKVISEKILPSLKKKGVSAKLLAIGDFPPKNIENPNVFFTGSVKILPEYINAADIGVVPLESGGGMRMKILEYFAAKIPVISTKRGAEGIGAKNGEEIIITRIDDFPNQIIKLIKSKKLRKKMTKNAFNYAQNYDWKKICQQYIDIYNKFEK